MIPHNHADAPVRQHDWHNVEVPLSADHTGHCRRSEILLLCFSCVLLLTLGVRGQRHCPCC